MRKAISVNYAGQPDFDSRKDFILVHVTNNGDSARTIEPKVIVESGLRSTRSTTTRFRSILTRRFSAPRKSLR